jgi:Uncharacterized conserved protein, COG1633
MTNLLNISEVYQIAMKIEENGIKFYSSWSKKVKDKKLKDIFLALTEAEVEHKKIFDKMLKEIESYEPKEVYTEEYFQYLRAYADGLIFDMKEIEKKSKQIKSVQKALDFAIGREKDSILYYQEVKNILPSHQHKELEKIINEERKHFLDLTHIKNSLSKSKNK